MDAQHPYPVGTGRGVLPALGMRLQAGSVVWPELGTGVPFGQTDGRMDRQLPPIVGHAS